MLFGAVEDRGFELVDGRNDVVNRAAHEQPQIGRHLVVARPRRVQPPGRRSDQLAEPLLDVHVDVLERGILRDAIFRILFGDGG